MMPHPRDWREELVERHPSLFGRLIERRGYPDCGEGWRDILNLTCIRIEAALDVCGHLQIDRIRKRYGTLRIYWSGNISNAVRLGVEEAVALATARSACTCEVCGNEGRLYSHSGRRSTSCTQHARGDPVPIRTELENLHIVRVFASDGLTSTISCWRYIRARDMFVDVDPRLFRLDP